MPTLTLSLTNNRVRAHEQGVWIPTANLEGPPFSMQYNWSLGWNFDDTPGPYFYLVAGGRFDLDALIGHPFAIDSASYHLVGSYSVSRVGTDFNDAPDIGVDLTSIASNGLSDVYGPVIGSLLSIASPAGGASMSIDQTGSVDASGFSGVIGLRAGFVSSVAPTAFSRGLLSTGEGADFVGSFSIIITYHLLCIEPGPLVQSAITCIDADGTDNSVAIDCLLLEQLADDYGITPFEDTASVKGTDQRAVLWFETCVLEQQFDSVTQIILALDIGYILRDPCNPTVRGYFTSQYAPTGELQPAIDDLDGTYYISPEGQTAFNPISAWALGRDTMIETSPDHEWLGPARVLIELAERDMIFHSRMTGIVITGDFSDGIGQVDVLGSSQLLVCGALNPANDDTPPDDSNQPGGNDDTPDDGDPGDDGGDGGKDDGSNDGSEDKPQGASKGERPQVTSQIAQPYQRPVPAKIHVLVTFLARLRRDGQVDEGG